MELFNQLFGGTKAPDKASLGGALDIGSQLAPYGLLTADILNNPASLLKFVTRSMKKKALEDMGLLTKALKGSKNTSAIKMAYGKRRNSRAKRSFKRRAPSRKRSAGRRGKTNGSKNLLSTIHKALKGQMSY